MTKIAIKILQGGVATQTMLGELIFLLQISYSICVLCATNYENWFAVDKVITITLL